MNLNATHSIALILLLLTTFLFPSLSVEAQQKGKASYYSNRLHGARMSDGSRYHRDSLTCANLRYPLGTLLKVTNLNNKQSVVVKVTDRGPHGRGRIIDLSYAAAKKIGMIAAGVAMVKVEPYKRAQGVPFKADDEPMFEFEFAEKSTLPVPEWQREWMEEKGMVAEMDEDDILQIKELHQTTREKTSKKTLQQEQSATATMKKKVASEQPATNHTPHKASMRH